MKIEDLHEGALDTVKDYGKAIGNAASGTIGAAQSQSSNPATRAKGKRKLGRAGAYAATSKRGVSIKRKKAVSGMMDIWNEKANQYILDNNGADPDISIYDEWIREFMDIGNTKRQEAIDKIPAPEGISDKEVKPHIEKLVSMFADDPTKGKPDEPGNTVLPSEPAAAKTNVGIDNPDAVSALKNMGHSEEEINAILKNAAAAGANPDNVEDIIKKGYKKPAKESIEKHFNHYLAEAGKGKNTHMEHLEDLVFNNGYEGANEAIEYVTQVVSMLSDGTGETAAITTKWDGSPAIVCGIDPSDGKFFVGTKTVFNTDPKLVKNASTLNKWYDDKPELKEKLALALKVLPKLGIGGVMQGDFMFDRASVEQVNINGEKMVTFTPNTITYAVPAGSDLANRILRAKMGIIFHTAYEGADLATMQASFGVDVSGLNQTKEVWVDDATFKDVTGKATLKTDELAKITNNIRAMQATMSKIRADKFNVVIDNKEFSKYIKPYTNQLVRDGKQISSSTDFLNDFLSFYKGKLQVEIDKISAEKGEDNVGVKNRIIKMQKKEEFLEDNSNAILGVLAVYKRIVEIKLLIIDKLHQVEGLHTFIKDGDGYDVTNPEGFVAIRVDGGAIKLVDRLEFSQRNFNAPKSYKPVTESDDLECTKSDPCGYCKKCKERGTLKVSEDKETLNPPSIDVGDEVKTGKFKNSKATVKGFKKDDHNQPVLKTNKGDKKLFSLRLSKLQDQK